MDQHIASRKSILSTTTPSTSGEKIMWTLVHKRKSYRGSYWPTHADIFRQTTFRSLGVLPPQIFTRVTDWPSLASAHQNWDGGPPKKTFNRENLFISGTDRYIANRKSIFINYNPFHVGWKIWWTLVHKQKRFVAHIDPPKRTFFGRLHFDPWGCCPIKLLHTLQIDQALLAHTTKLGRGPPPKKKN